MDIVRLSKDLMREQTQKNGAPAWLLTQIAIRKGNELAAKYEVNKELVLVSLYLAHTVFDPIYKGDIQKKHPLLSAQFAEKYLKKRGVSEEDMGIILNAIQAHHGEIPCTSPIAEIVKNAECFKFVSVQGAMIWLHELGLRQVPFTEAVKRVIQKMKDKQSLLTLKECIDEAEIGCTTIVAMFNAIEIK